ncbi:hypothetical protein PPL_09593 [Heterostelium album PN500]|uniref:S-adenosyl-L-methionine-dependent methyltransferase n=1 Tax=Heterostelium pallidum (strain ATCC 26659 / Pp 5 / PN500) TaxID=670386 RepID=D3BNS2_HETP5|nr:hypothetical protein PPL_09593 [Heterostelium album PN500]EFA76841.1 hypothetical protein PPL_09593 [Heterostelium album PN500]|eukprot:XP_020428973.1 hypothetical protein PPL_09593 [Heterostelium album PN500]
MEELSVPTTSLFVCSLRLYITNQFVKYVLEKENGDQQSKELVKSFFKKYDPDLPNIVSRYSNILVYDPYSYYFCKTNESLLYISDSLNKINDTFPGNLESKTFEKEVLEEIQFPTNLRFPELKNYILNSKNPMMSWTLLNSKGLLLALLFRTRYIDDFIVEKINEGYDQFVLLGAGLDSRGYRLPFKSGTTVWEVDFPEVLNYKQFVLESVKDVIPKVSQANNVYITSDLLKPQDWTSQLQSTGFDSNKKTIWIMEGLLFYIERSGISLILNSVSKLSSSGSGACMQNMSADLTEKETFNPMVLLCRKEMRSLSNDPYEYQLEMGFTKDVKIYHESQIEILYKISEEKIENTNNHIIIAYKP